jgi:stearoyl-CoA desaturase (delta-9 desaturase)
LERQIKLKAESLEKWVAGLSVVVPLLSCIPVTLLFLRSELALHDYFIFIFMCTAGILGITVGYHRYLTHSAFRASRATRIVLAIMGSISSQGPVLYWVDIHRRHHKAADQAADPHSPLFYGGRLTLKGFLRAHLSWMFESHQHDWARSVRDLLNDRDILFVHQNYFIWLTLGCVLPGLLSLFFSLTFFSFVKGVLIGGLFRICVVHQITWSVNSFCHSFGSRDHPTPDQSRNFWPIGWLALGEGWHNNHHAFQYSAKQGLKAWQIDVSYLFIRLLKTLGLASELKYPKEKHHG